MGEREFEYRLTTEKAVDKEAELFNMPPYSIPFFPSGNGKIKNISVEIDNDKILLTTMRKEDDGILIRLFNTQNSANTSNISVFGVNTKISLAPYEYKTYMVQNSKVLEISETLC